MQWSLNLLEAQKLLIVLHLQICTPSREMHKGSNDLIESHKSVIYAICSKLSGFTKHWKSVRTGEVVLYTVLPVLVSLNCLGVYPENADLSEQFFVWSLNTLLNKLFLLADPSDIRLLYHV